MDKKTRLESVTSAFRQAGTIDVGLMTAEQAEKGYFHEFGTKHIPPRPFMTIALEEGRRQIDSDLITMTRAIADGKATFERAAGIVGQRHADRIKYTIGKVDILPALKSETVKRKGSAKTLVDHGHMLNAVTFRVNGK